MTISVRITHEGGPPDKKLEVVLVNKGTKKQQLMTRLENAGDTAVVSVWQEQNIILREDN